MPEFRAVRIRKGEYVYRGHRMLYGQPTARERAFGHRPWACTTLPGRVGAETKAQMMAIIDRLIEEVIA